MIALSSVVSPSNKKTWEYLENKIGKINLQRKGRTVYISVEDEEYKLVPYPEIDHVKLERENGLVVPKGIDASWTAQWKANGSNIRIYEVGNELIAFTRGGYLLDWRPFQALINSELKDNLLDAVEEGRYLLFGELVGRDSLVKLCVKEWNSYLKANIGYLVFDIYDMEKEAFLGLRDVEKHSTKHGLRFAETEWEWTAEKLNTLLEKFLNTCGGEMWEGFVFKKPDRGDINKVWKETLKWRMDSTKEYAHKVIRERTKQKKVWELYEALRKFIIEGYTDPPITKREVSEEENRIREQIQEILKRAENVAEREKLEKKLKNKLLTLTDRIVSNELKTDKKYNKIKWEASKIFIKIHLYTI